MATPIPDNRASFTLPELLAVTRAELLTEGASPVVGVTTDSRGNVGGRLFVALTGERFDGHAYAAAATECGAAAVLVMRSIGKVRSGVSVLRVPDTLAALGALAHFHRVRWRGRVVAVAGSAGKTTTRAAMSALLAESRPGRVHFVPGNLNNLVGVPMVLLGLGPQHELGIVELGTNQPGEVERLSRITQADVGVLTLVGLEHAAFLGTLDQIEAEEGALLRGLPPSAGAVANGDDPRAMSQLHQSPAVRKLSYGTGSDCDYRLLERQVLDCHGARLTVERCGQFLRCDIPLVGEAGARAVLGGLCAVETVLGELLPTSELERALGRAELREPGRLFPIELANGSLVLDDSYNANPPSVRSSISTARELAERRGARLVLVLGEMRELGRHSVPEHSQLGSELGQSGAGLLVAMGGDARHLADAAQSAGLQVHFVSDAASALARLKAELRPRDVVLVKASRGVGAERVVAGLTHRDSRGDSRGTGATA
ncbi:UDP-N-acetylmuramoyl-tripeptide--D-alanyl-D-alanine ligase [Myxococcota bacterium]